MSFVRAKKDLAEPAYSSRCAAYGCPCRGIVSVEHSRPMCAYHAHAMPDDLQKITQKLNENKWLLEFIEIDVVGMERKFLDWRGFAAKYWAGIDDECAPALGEPHANYVNRMKAELAFRCGISAKRPQPRLPQQHGNRFGASALAQWRKAA